MKDLRITRPLQVDVNAAYPIAGKAKNVTNSGDGTGTPWTADVINDRSFGWQENILKRAGIVANGLEEDADNSQIAEAIERVSAVAAQGKNLAGSSRYGCTLTSEDDWVVDNSGNYWQWAGAYPKTVPAATTPSSPAYTQVTFNDAQAVVYGENGNVDTALRKRAGYYTLTEAQAANLEVGQYIVITDRDFALAIIDPVGTNSDGYGYVGMSNNNVIRIIAENNVYNVKHFGAKGDWFNYTTGTINPNPTDDAPAINAVYGYMTRGDGVSGFGWSVYYPTSYYAIGTEIKSPSVTRSYGDGRYNSHIVALAGFTGVMFGDKGSASKLYVHDLEVDTRDEAGVTDAVKMGYGVPFGTEGGLYELLLTGGETNAQDNTDGLNVVGNVGLFHHISVIKFKRCVNEGPNSTSNHFDNFVVLGGKERSFALNTGAKLTSYHIEAPLVGSVPISIGRSAMIGSGTVSLGNDSITDIIVMDSGSLAINVDAMLVLTSNAGTYTNILNDQRPSSSSQFWANNASRNGLFSFGDALSQPIGSAGEIKQVSTNLQLNNDVVGGGVLIGTTKTGDTKEYFITNSELGFDGPSVDNTRNLARSGQRYTNGFFVNTPTGTSDRNLKTGFSEISPELKAAALDIKSNIQVWQWLHRVGVEGDSARLHIGPIAQDIYNIMHGHGLNPFDYALLGKDEVLDEQGNLVGEVWSVKHVELIMLILSSL